MKTFACNRPRHVVPMMQNSEKISFRGTGHGAKPRIQLASELRAFAHEFNPILQNYIEEQIQNSTLRQRTTYALRLTGVRERAFLVRVSAQLCRVCWKDVLPIALAAECFISSALTADDVLDRAATRWTKPTVWKRWGDGQAWLIAELLHSLAQLSLDSVGAAALPLRSAFAQLVQGQSRQIAFHKTYSKEETLELAMERTGALIQACVVAPAVMVESPLRKALATFGENLGMAFQLTDDLFDFLGNPKLMGKPNLGDLLNGQPNIVLAHALMQKDGPNRQVLIQSLGKGCARRPEDVRPILVGLKKLGSINYACELVNLHVIRAEKALESIPKGRPKSLLEGFLQLVSTLPVNHERL